MIKHYEVAKVVQLASFSAKNDAAISNSDYTDLMVFNSDPLSTYDCKAYLMEDKDTVYVVFHAYGATDSLSNKRFSSLGLNKQYWEMWRELSSDVATELLQRRVEMANDLHPKKQIVYCGHGIGGALAVIAAATHSPTECVTFGSPPVSGKAFVKYVQTLPTSFTRYVLDRDPIPRVHKWNPFYKHVGFLTYIDSAMNCHDEPSLWFRLKAWVIGSHNSEVNEHDNSMPWYKAALYVRDIE